jgi:hypothetical protein
MRIKQVKRKKWLNTQGTSRPAMTKKQGKAKTEKCLSTEGGEQANSCRQVKTKPKSVNTKGCK